MHKAVLSEIWIYPVKSLAGIALQQADIDARGFKWDRHWMLVDASGRFVSQREIPQMALLRVALDEQTLVIASGDAGALEIGLQQNSGETVKVQVWRDTVQALRVGGSVDEWLSARLGRPLSLVCMAAGEVRQLDRNYAREGEQTGFADGFPFLLLGRASVDDLNRRIDNPREIMEPRRFRPNLLIDGTLPYAEDDWQRVRIGEVVFRLVKPCSRCAITTVDPDTARRGREPLATLNRYRRQGNQVFFGQNLVHEGSGRLYVGNTLEVLA